MSDMDKSQKEGDPDSPPKTPDVIEKIPKDDSFKTCKTTMATPGTRRQLRMTPARISIVNGHKIFKEATNSGKKFNSANKKLLRSAGKVNSSNKKGSTLRELDGDVNDTAGSNETFIRYEQELMFDRDSLEPENIITNHNNNSSSPTLNNKTAGANDNRRNSTPKKSLTPAKKKASPIKKTPSASKKIPSPIKQKSPMRHVINRHRSPTKRIQTPSARKNPPLKTNNRVDSQAQQSQQKPLGPPKTITTTTMAPPLMRNPNITSSIKRGTGFSSVIKRGAQTMRQKLVTPQLTFKKPVTCLASTASKYLDSSKWNSSRLTRSSSYRSTAEIERDYIRSLRSFY